MNKRVFLTCFLLLFSVIIIATSIVLIFNKKHNEDTNANNLKSEQSSQNEISDKKKGYVINDNTIITDKICESAYQLKDVVSKNLSESVKENINQQELNNTSSEKDSREQSHGKNDNRTSNKGVSEKSDENIRNVQKEEAKEETKEETKEATNDKAETKNKENVSPGWIYYCSKGGNGLSGDQKAYLDSVIDQWTCGSISSAAVENKFAEKIAGEWNLQMSVVGVSGNQVCLYKSKSDIPDYKSIVSSRSGTYNFIGLYTKGEYDECGNLICYYWEAGVM